MKRGEPLVSLQRRLCPEAVLAPPEARRAVQEAVVVIYAGMETNMTPRPWLAREGGIG